MNPIFKCLGFAFLATLSLASSAFAIDQVTLTNGQVVQGKVLNDVPNRHVDFELTNGNTKRFERSEIASVERDVPNRVKDREMYGNQSSGFASVLLGGAYRLNGGSDNNLFLDYGVKFGLNSAQMGDFARMGFVLSYDRISKSYNNVSGIIGNDYTSAYNDLNLQMLFMRVNNSGFYFGPNIGLAISSSSNYLGASSSQSNFEAGFGVGYEAFLSDSFSVGPDVRYEHIFGDNGGANYLKFALALTLHF